MDQIKFTGTRESAVAVVEAINTASTDLKRVRAIVGTGPEGGPTVTLISGTEEPFAEVAVPVGATVELGDAPAVIVAEAAQYRKKPVVIEAIHVIDNETFMAAGHWMDENGYPWLTGDATIPASLYVNGHEGEPVSEGVWIDPADGALMIRTLEGDMRVTSGDYVIRGVQGEFYPCKPDIFAATYEAVSS